NTIPFEMIRKLLREALTNNFKPLPDSPDLIPEHITEFLPFTLPIAEHSTTILCLANRRTKGSTPPYSTGIAIKSTITISVGPNASP
ncbi:27186_t:CDS:2, partial [Gigaspora margarita]